MSCLRRDTTGEGLCEAHAMNAGVALRSEHGQVVVLTPKQLMGMNVGVTSSQCECSGHALPGPLPGVAT